MVDSLPNVRAVFLTQTGPEGASARYRVYAYLPYLERAGIETVVWPLPPPASGGKITYYAGSFLRRWQQAGRARGFDVAVLQRDLINHLRPVLEKRLFRAGVPILLDVDDAIHLRPPGRPAGFLARAFGSADKLADLVPLARCVLAGNEELLRVCRERGARRVRLLPTAIDFSRIGPLPKERAPGNPFVLGWIGSPGTVPYLEAIRPALEDLGRKGGFLLRVVGAKAPAFKSLATESLPWSLENENTLVEGFDAGLMPLSDDPWSRAKCGTKLLQYMALGVPAVASPVGANLAIVDPRPGATGAGLLASHPQEWVAALEHLRADPQLRAQLRAQGRSRVEGHYNVESLAPDLIEEIRQAART